MRDLARTIRDLADAGAHQDGSAVDDMAGGTFTITNPGPFGTLMTGAVINQPQVAILSTDGVTRKPVGRDRRRRRRGDRHPLGRACWR